VPIPAGEYLSSVYEPDCDYIDGELQERNTGRRDHSMLQAAVAAYFFERRKDCKTTGLIAVRVRVQANRFRVPDVCIVLGDTEEQILTRPPFLCIEILSPDDRFNRVKERINDFLAMGVPYVWIIDSQTKQAYIATATEGLREVKDGMLRTANPAFELPLSDLLS
jgi:Uma2 family endonuclease